MRVPSLMRSLAAAAAATVLVAPGGAAAPDGSPPPAPPAEAVPEARHLFRNYGVGAPGVTARGPGPAADRLRTPPADLTRIEPDEHGAFPRERVHRAIEGIDTTPGHAPSEMPVWGFALAPLDRDADPADEVRSRIATLVDYLETLQAPPD